MNYDAFYDQLFKSVEDAFGRTDAKGIFHIVGFDCGGPLNFSTIGAEDKSKFVTYISCELAVRKEQIPSSHGRFELLCHSNDEDWVRHILTKLGQMSLESGFDHGHTVDLTAIVDPQTIMRGVILERFAVTVIDDQEFCILRVHGITAEEQQLAINHGSSALFEVLKRSGVYPKTDVKRSSTI